MLSQEYLTIPEVATLLKIHEITVRRMLKAKTLPAYKVGKMYRFRRDEIDAYLKSLRDSTIPLRSEKQPQSSWIDDLEMIDLEREVQKSGFSRTEMIVERGVE